MRAAREPDERLLHEILGGVAVVDEQARQPNERRRLLAEQVDDERVDVDRRIRPRRRRATPGAAASVIQIGSVTAIAPTDGSRPGSRVTRRGERVGDRALHGPRARRDGRISGRSTPHAPTRAPISPASEKSRRRVARGAASPVSTGDGPSGPARPTPAIERRAHGHERDRDRGPAQGVPGPARAPRSRRSTASTSRSRRPACSGSSARTARARPRRSAACSGSCARRAGSVRLLGRPVPGGLHDAIRQRRRDRRDARAVPDDDRAREPAAARRGRPHRRRAASTRCSATVGLDDRAGDLVKKYSLGMRQRLALAADAAEGSRAADPRRAGERSRPGRHPSGARAAPPARRRGPHGVRVEPHPLGDRAHLRPRRDPEPRPLRRATERCTRCSRRPARARRCS